MIRILDTMAMEHLYRNGVYVREEHSCFVPPEIRDEFVSDSLRDDWFKKNRFVSKHLDEVEYLKAYASYLNRYRGVSFYSLKGFGDVAILAVLDMFASEAPRTQSLFHDDAIHLVTDDRTLRKFVGKTFTGQVSIQGSAAFARTIAV